MTLPHFPASIGIFMNWDLFMYNFVQLNLVGYLFYKGPHKH